MRIAQALGTPSVTLTELIGSSGQLRDLWLGDPGGLLQLEILEFVSDAAPSTSQLQAAWRKRRAGRASPLVIFWQGEEQTLATEPDGEPVPRIVALPTAAAMRILPAALRIPRGEVVAALLSLFDRAQGSGGISGFWNRGLVSTHSVSKSYKRNVARWGDLTAVGASVRDKSGSLLLKALGFKQSGNASTYSSSEKGVPAVYALVIADGSSLDRSATGVAGAPTTRLLVEARQRGADRAVIVAGGTLRLYLTASAVQVDDLMTPSTYVELDLDLLDAQWNPLIALFFSAESLRSGGAFDQLLEESSRYAVQLRDRFRTRVYDEVVGGLVTELFRASPTPSPLATDTLFHATLRFLYRLLFVLYAEDRNLLPLGNADYRRYSVTEALLRIERHTADRKPFDPKATDLWDGLFQIFAAIRNGHREWNVPEYDGGLFEPAVEGQPEAAFLESVKLTNAALAPLLLALAFDEEGGERGKIDFADLGVRQLGTLYEGLLSYTVHVADIDLSVDGRDGSYVAATAERPLVVRAGQPYLATPKGTRKTSGSYYTPSTVVRRIVDEALLPTLQDHLRVVEEEPVEKQWDALLDFRVVDPAMGSGHFLVDAVDAISDRVATFLREHPRLSAAPLLESRERISCIGRDVGLDDLGERVSDFDLLRRIVLKNCIFGADVQPMAVELAKLSLWLHAFVPGLPLSYLGHNLRVGNGLVGVVGAEIDKLVGGTLFGEALRISLQAALTEAELIARSTDLALEDVRASGAAQRSLVEKTEHIRSAFDAFSCRWFAGDAGPVLEHSDALQSIIDNRVHSGYIQGIEHAKAIATELSALHWQLAFPEVFQRDRPGFDVVLGNPPWEEVTVEELGFFASYVPGLKGIASQAERQALIDSYAAQHPYVRALFESERERVGVLKTIVRRGYELSTSGDADLYRAFAERSLRLTRDGGAIGMVYPRALFAGKGTAPFRAVLFSEFDVTLDFALNAGGWLFADVHAQTSLCAMSARRLGPGAVRVGGPALNQDDWDRMISQRREWTVAELAVVSKGLEIPFVAGTGADEVFQKLVFNGQRFDAAIANVVFRPWREFHATDDRKNGLLTEDPSGAPVYSGDSFDHLTPEYKKPPFFVELRLGLEVLNRKRHGSKVWKVAPKGTRLPPEVCHVLFRDSTNRLNARTVIAALIPPGVFAINNAPDILQFGGSQMDLALRLGIMSSVAFDWAARRRVERHLSYFILISLPVPRAATADPRGRRVAMLAARISSVDERFAEFAQACGVPFGPLSHNDREAALAELDALVASMYGLNEEDLQTIFADFSFEAVSPERRALTKQAFLNGVLPP